MYADKYQVKLFQNPVILDKSKIMKSLFLLLFSALSLPVLAQIEGGGFGHFQVGPSAGKFGSMEQYLNNMNSLSPVAISRGGMMAGGAGYGIVRNLLIGGQGMAVSHVVSNSENASIMMSCGTGMFSMGYIVYSRNKMFLYPYLSIGAGGYSLSMENKGNTTLNFGNQKVNPGETKIFTLEQSMYDLGFSLKGLPFARKAEQSGGFMLGVELGTLLSVPVGNWNNDQGDFIQEPPVFGQFQPYLRISIGGGGFKRKAK